MLREDVLLVYASILTNFNNILKITLIFFNIVGSIPTQALI